MADAKHFKELEKVSVTCEGELRKALEPFLDDKSKIRSILMEGMEIVRRQLGFHKAAEAAPVEGFGGYLPAKPVLGTFHWVDTLISRRMAGKRDGVQIFWDLKDGKFVFDPWTKSLVKMQSEQKPN